VDVALRIAKDGRKLAKERLKSGGDARLYKEILQDIR